MTGRSAGAAPPRRAAFGRCALASNAFSRALRAGGFGLACGVVGALPCPPAGAASFAYITNQGDDDVSVIDLERRQVVATVPVGHSPAGVAAASGAGRVYVSNPDSKTVSVIDVPSARVVATLAAGDGPLGIDVSADGSVLAVADFYRRQLLLFDGRAQGGEPRLVDVGRAPAGVAVDADRRTVFVAERDDDSLAAIDVGSGRVMSRLRVGTHPFALLLDAPRRRLYILNVGSDDVSVVDIREPRRLAVAATVKVGKAPYGAALADGGALLYVTNQHADSVSVIDADTLTPLRTLGGFGYPEGIAAWRDQVLVVNWMDDAMSVLDARTGARLASIATGRNPRGFGAFVGTLADAAEARASAAPNPLDPRP